MIKYQQDEKRLLERIHHQHNSIREVSSSDTKSDIVVLGLKNAGKSVIVNAIKKFEFLQNEIINEVSYDEMHSFNDIIKQIENADAKLYLIVIPNTVGSLDAKIASDLVQTNKNIVILLNKSDEIIDNLKKQGTFTSTESYIEKRHNAANFDLSKLNIKNIPIFSMGQGASSVLAHPLTGLALNIGYTWLSSMSSSNESRDYEERALLHTFNNAGIDVSQMNGIMPNQEEYIRRMQGMEVQLNTERALTRQAKESLKRAEQKLKEQMKINAEMQNYLSSKPSKRVKMESKSKLSSAEAAQQNGVDNVNYVNFAFVGHTKNGKSSLINAIRGLTKDDLDAAGVDVLECTQTIKWYTVPNGKMPNVRFYDVPGSGAMSHKAADYFFKT
uniref:IRG-type G domain-containing protein n=1 Tax=Panagrolaimus sp. ES5 TaxID=591445 RepID=A0AC34G3F1_9BILA